MFDLLRNLRLPPLLDVRRRPQPARRPPPARRSLPERRQFALGRAPRPEPPRRARIPWRRIGVTFAGVALLAGSAYGAAWLVTGDSLRVLEIDVAGAQVEHPMAVAHVAGVGAQSMLTADLRAAEEAVAALPGIKSATVTRDWPRGVRIAVAEHQAWGYWQVANQVLVIDADGRMLQRSRPAPPDAPTIIELAGPREVREGATVDPDTVRLVARMHDERIFRRMGIEPSGFVFRRDRGLTVLTPGAPDAIFGDSSNYEFKVQVWRGLLEQVRQDSIEAREVDLRFGRNVVLR